MHSDGSLVEAVGILLIDVSGGAGVSIGRTDKTFELKFAFAVNSVYTLLYSI